LGPDELTAVRGRLQALGSLQPSKEAASPIEDWLLEGIFSELNRRGLMAGRVPLKRVKEIAPKYAVESERVRGLLMRGLRRPPYVQLLSLGRVSARALADYLQSWASVSLQSLLQNAGKTPEALDASFPDYLSSGMLTYLINSGSGNGR
jgi:hypothetical protein